VVVACIFQSHFHFIHPVFIDKIKKILMELRIQDLRQIMADISSFPDRSLSVRFGLRNGLSFSIISSNFFSDRAAFSTVRPDFSYFF